MEFNVGQIKKNVVVVTVSGSLNDVGADDFLKRVDGLVAEGVKNFVLECSQLEFVSSFGLGVLVRLRKRFASVGGRAALAAVPDEILKVLKLTALDKVLTIYDDVESATIGLTT